MHLNHRDQVHERGNDDSRHRGEEGSVGGRCEGWEDFSRKVSPQSGDHKHRHSNRGRLHSNLGRQCQSHHGDDG